MGERSTIFSKTSGIVLKKMSSFEVKSGIFGVENSRCFGEKWYFGREDVTFF